jgi:predicted XRE-type DNA-binding protein
MNMTVADVGWQACKTLSPLLLPMLGWVVARLAQLITARVDNEYLRGVLLRLDDAVFAAVRELQQIVVDDLKSTSTDGRLTQADKARIKQDALLTIRSHLGTNGLKEVATILGLDNGEVNKLISTKIEAAVHDLKMARVAAGAGMLIPATA